MKETNSSQVKVCDICGDIGIEDCISACFNCKINHEHSKFLPQNTQAKWHCDNCEKDTVASPKYGKRGLESTLVSKPSACVYDEGTSSRPRESGEQQRKEESVTTGGLESTLVLKSSASIYGQDRSSRPNGEQQSKEKIVTTGKVKCIPVQEAMKLQSGLMRGDSPAMTAKRLNSSPLTIVRSTCPRTPIPKRTPSYSPVILTPSPANRQTHSGIQRKGDQIARDVSKGKKVQFAKSVAVMAPGGANDATAIKQATMPCEVSRLQSSEKQVLPPIRTGKSRFTCLSVAPPRAKDATSVKKARTSSEAKCAPLPKKQFLPPIHPGHQVSGDLVTRDFEIENSAVRSMECEAKRHSPGPACSSSWSGHFEVHGGMFKNIKSCFKAHPRFNVRQNVVDISSGMPELLPLKMIPRKMVSAELFQDHFPDEDDIGLYFFSGERKRSSDYDFLLAFMGAKDLAMRCNISGVEIYPKKIFGVELFLFTSKILFSDSKKLDAEYYIWGVFRKVKKEKAVSKLYEELSVVLHQALVSAENNDTDNNDDDAADDMEVDMVAGEDIGIIDIVVPRDSPNGIYSGEGHVISSVDIKKEPTYDFPPGFEIRQDIQKI